MKTISVKEITKAAKKNKIRLVRRNWGEKVGTASVTCGCPLTQLYIACGNSPLAQYGFWNYYYYFDSSKVANWASQKYGKDFSQGFVDGVDRRRLTKEQRKNKKFMRGYYIGRRIADSMEKGSLKQFTK